MRRRPAVSRRLRGMSLVELMIATALMAALMASVVVVVRSGYAAWNAQEADIDRLENAYGVMRHFVQQLRQASSVTAISAPSNMSGSLSFVSAAGPTRTWSYNSGTSEVTFNNGTSNQVLAKDINALNFVGYEADGVTATTTVGEIQVVKCTAQVTLPRGGGVTRTVSCRAWIRSW